MFSKSIEKYVNSLKQKKYRIAENCFIAEGEKIAGELLASDYTVRKIIATAEWLHTNQSMFGKKNPDLCQVTEREMKRISALTQPSAVMLVAEIPPATWAESTVNNQLSLVLEDIRDPGNLGTIIRIADWFGITYIFCSGETVDAYNPKVIQSSMGSICRVQVVEMPLANLFQRFPELPVYATALEGESIYSAALTRNGFIVIGNEARGISSQVKPYVTRVLTIPGSGRAESLNAAVAAGIVCAMFRKPQVLP